MYDGYLALGCNEVLSSPRAYGYTHTADCPIEWLRIPDCDLAAAFAERAYIADNIEDAPWYDAEDEPTHRFYGAYSNRIEQLSDSTRTANLVEGILDGGVIAGVRHTIRTFRCNATLIAEGEDALEAGMSWLNAALRPDECGIHGSSCGEVDATFFVACPNPLSDFDTEAIEWTTVATNLAHDPAATSDASVGGGTRVGWQSRWFGGGAGTGTVLLIKNATDGPIPELTSYSRKTWTAVPAGNGDTGWSNSSGAGSTPTIPAGEGMVVKPSTTYTFSAYVRATSASNKTANLSVTWRDAAGTMIGPIVASQAPTLTPGMGWVRVVLTATAPANAVRVGIVTDCDGGTTWAVGDTFDGTGLLIEESASLSPYYDGNTPATEVPLVQYAWTGTPNASTSVREAGTVYAVSHPEVYEEYIDSLTRVLHGVVALSGPTVQQKLRRGKIYGYVVEFTLAASTPFVFTLPREIALDPAIPSVVQENPINLVAYPSAELGTGGIVVATNLATNPSGEVDLLGYASTGYAAVASANVAAPVASTEIAAPGAGTKSVKVVYTATSASSSSGYIIAAYDLFLGYHAAAGDKLSFSVWGHGRLKSGTAVLGNLEAWAISYDETQQASGLEEVRIGIVPNRLGVVSLQNHLMPTGTERIMIELRQYVTTHSTGAVVEVFMDAVAITKLA